MQRRRKLGLVLVAALIATGGVVAAAASEEPRRVADTLGIPAPIIPPLPALEAQPEPAPTVPPAHRAISRAVGKPWAGRLVNGVRLPAEGVHFFTWDPARDTTPNRPWRRWGTDRLIRTVIEVLDEYAAAHPNAPRVGIGDLSRPHGGDFGARFGALGHASHQNGLDVDVYYPRRDGREREPRNPRQIDRRLAQSLVDLFVEAGAQYVFVGLHTGLTGPRRVVQAIPHHDNHMHVRIFSNDRAEALHERAGAHKHRAVAGRG